MTSRRPLPVAPERARERAAAPPRGCPEPADAREVDAPSRHHAITPSTAADAVDCASAEWRALRDVMDPEFPVSIVDLGLVYAVRRRAGDVEVDLTFTATGCPCMDFIREDVAERLSREPGVMSVTIRDVWDPPWSPDRITPAGRAALRRGGVGA